MSGSNQNNNPLELRQHAALPEGVSNNNTVIDETNARILEERTTAINGTINIIGDSLSDAGNSEGKYYQNMSGYIPVRYFLDKSPNNMFTDTFTYSYALAERMKAESMHIHSRNPLYTAYFDSFGYTVDRNMAQGGATAYRYKKVANLFNKLFYGAVFSYLANLSDIKTQSKSLKHREHGIKRDDLCIIFSGANDFVTVGYTGEEAVLRAVSAVEKTIMNLSTAQQGTGGITNYSKNILLFTLPDISMTARYDNASDSKKRKIRETCESFNVHLKKVANDYQYINFDTCPIYRFDKIENEDVFLAQHNIKQAILFVGEGKKQRVLFINNGKFVTNSQGETRVVEVKLSKKQQKLLEQVPQDQHKEIAIRPTSPDFQEWINQLTRDAKLNANDYQYINFDTCPIYRFDKIENEDVFLAQHNIKQAILFVGEEKKQRVLFINNGKFVTNSQGETRVVEVKLSEKQQKLLEQVPQYQHKEIAIRPTSPDFQEWINQLTRDAKLNAEVKIFDAAKVFADIIGYPEKYGITPCSIYYSDTQEIPAEQIQENAVLIKPCTDHNDNKADHLEICFFIDGKLVMSEENVKSLPLNLTPDGKKVLTDMIGDQKGLVQLKSPDNHNNARATQFIQNLIADYQKTFDERIELIDRKKIFWDGLHPTGQIHLLLETILVTECLRENYRLQPDRQFLDDMGIPTQKKYRETRAYEAPGRLGSRYNSQQFFSEPKKTQPTSMTNAAETNATERAVSTI